MQIAILNMTSLLGYQSEAVRLQQVGNLRGTKQPSH